MSSGPQAIEARRGDQSQFHVYCTAHVFPIANEKPPGTGIAKAGSSLMPYFWL